MVMVGGSGSRTKGRQKVAMVKMARMSNLQVTFSKRRSGLFKKASELCTMCDADVALIVFSPGEKVFSFGHPSVDTVLDRYVSARPSQDDRTNVTLPLPGLNSQLTQVGNQLEAARKHNEDIAAAMEHDGEGLWWHNPVDSMDKQQLLRLCSCLDDLSKTVAFHYDRMRTFVSLARQLGPAFDPNNMVSFFPPPLDFNPLTEFEHKVNVFGGGPPPPHYDPNVTIMMPAFNGAGPLLNPFGFF